jgi:predicted acetyltransferase
MSIELRPIQPDEFLSFCTAAARGFGEHAQPDELEHERPLFEFDRSLAAFDGDQIVGTGEIFSFQLTVPGPRTVPAGGVSWIAVLPTHRRRGILTSIMQRQIQDVRERGEYLAMLWASESIIYPRFGYGMASSQMRFELNTVYRTFAHSPSVDGRERFVEKDAALSVLPPIYDRYREQQPGAITRSQAYWKFHLSDPERWWKDSSPRFYIVHENASGEADGYVTYRIKNSWGEGFPSNTVKVEDLISVNPAARAALWRFLFNIDLVASVEGWVPVDEPLRWMLADSRRFRLSRYSDGIWLRLVDVPSALAARPYACEDRLVVQVEDSFYPENTGRYEVDGGSSGAQAKRTDADPHLAMTINDLSAAYLGGITFTTMARAGRVEECQPGALRRADLMFSSDSAPFCLTGF